MKKLVLGFAIAVSLMVGIAGSAGAIGPDVNGCANAQGNGTTVVTNLGCEDHRVFP